MQECSNSNLWWNIRAFTCTLIIIIIIWFMELPDYSGGHENSIMWYAFSSNLINSLSLFPNIQLYSARFLLIWFLSFFCIFACVKKVFFPITAQREACVCSRSRGWCLFCPTPSQVWDNFVYLVTSPPLYLSAEATWDQTSAWATWLACYLYKLPILRACVAYMYIFSVFVHLHPEFEFNSWFSLNTFVVLMDI